MRIPTCQPIKRLMWLCAGVILVAGCAGQATRLNSLSFQNGQALSNEQILLKNIIAAAHQRTPTFVASSGVTSGIDATGQLSGTFHLTDIGHTLTPQLTAKKSQSVTILDYGATKAAQYLYKAVPDSYLTQLQFQGWSGELIETILYSGIYIHPELGKLIDQQYQEICDTTEYETTKALCNWVTDKIKTCGEPFDFYSYAFSNSAQNICEFNRFQIVLIKARIANVNWKVRKEQAYDTKGMPVFDKQGQPVLVEKVVNFIQDEKINDKFEELQKEKEEEDKKKEGGKPTVPILALVLRSPAQIIEFLGRLAAMQLYRDPPFVARIPLWSDGSVIPFRVVRGSDLEGPSAVSVRAGALGTYHVPQPDPLSPDRDHQSLRIMALVIELQNRARQEAPIQGATIAIVQ